MSDVLIVWCARGGSTIRRSLALSRGQLCSVEMSESVKASRGRHAPFPSPLSASRGRCERVSVAHVWEGLRLCVRVCACACSVLTLAWVCTRLCAHTYRVPVGALGDICSYALYSYGTCLRAGVLAACALVRARLCSRLHAHVQLTLLSGCASVPANLSMSLHLCMSVSPSVRVG